MSILTFPGVRMALPPKAFSANVAVVLGGRLVGTCHNYWIDWPARSVASWYLVGGGGV